MSLRCAAQAHKDFISFFSPVFCTISRVRSVTVNRFTCTVILSIGVTWPAKCSTKWLSISLSRWNLTDTVYLFLLSSSSSRLSLCLYICLTAWVILPFVCLSFFLTDLCARVLVAFCGSLCLSLFHLLAFIGSLFSQWLVLCSVEKQSGLSGLNSHTQSLAKIVTPEGRERERQRVSEQRVHYLVHSCANDCHLAVSPCLLFTSLILFLLLLHSMNCCCSASASCVGERKRERERKLINDESSSLFTLHCEHSTNINRERERDEWSRVKDFSLSLRLTILLWAFI